MLIQSIMYPDFTAMDLIGVQQTLSKLPGARIECVVANVGAVMTDAGVALVADKSFRSASRAPDIMLVPGGRLSSNHKGRGFTRPYPVYRSLPSKSAYLIERAGRCLA